MAAPMSAASATAWCRSRLRVSPMGCRSISWPMAAGWARPAETGRLRRSGPTPMSLARSDAGRDAVVLLSGGLDSMVAAGLAAEAGFRLNALTIDYGQRHRRELQAAAS